MSPDQVESANGTIDPVDRRILRALQEDGRMTVQALADKVGLSASPCLRRLRQLERAGIISGYSANIEQKAVGLPVSVFISIKLERQRAGNLDAFGAAISRWPEVMECYLMTGQLFVGCRKVFTGPATLEPARNLAEELRIVTRCDFRVQGAQLGHDGVRPVYPEINHGKAFAMKHLDRRRAHAAAVAAGSSAGLHGRQQALRQVCKPTRFPIGGGHGLEDGVVRNQIAGNCKAVLQQMTRHALA